MMVLYIDNDLKSTIITSTYEENRTNELHTVHNSNMFLNDVNNEQIATSLPSESMCKCIVFYVLTSKHTNFKKKCNCSKLT